MSQEKKIAVLVGSLRKESYSLKIAKAFIAMAPSQIKLEIVEIGQLALYNEDLDNKEPPVAWTAFRKQIGQADAFLFITPEYNRSMPAVLKNALDVASRPYGQNKFDGKPGGVVSSSIGAIGGFGANHHLRQSLVFLNVPLLQQPEIYLSTVNKLFDEQGNLQQTSHEFFANFMKAYVNWIHTILG